MCGRSSCSMPFCLSLTHRGPRPESNLNSCESILPRALPLLTTSANTLPAKGPLLLHLEQDHTMCCTSDGDAVVSRHKLHHLHYHIITFISTTISIIPTITSIISLKDHPMCCSSLPNGLEVSDGSMARSSAI